MDEQTITTLQVDSLVELLARHVQTPLGRRRALTLRPSTGLRDIEHTLDLTTECVDYLKSGHRFGLSGITDPEAAMAQLHVEGTILEPLQIIELERLISVGLDLRGLFRNPEGREHTPKLAGLTERIPDLHRLLADIHGKILPGGEVDDNASPDLKLIRRNQGDKRARIYHRLETILRDQTRAVQDDIVTFRNERFVIPVRTDARGLIPGVVHGLSSSGHTTFLEPLSVIEENNELVRLREQEEAEIARILSAITENLRNHLDALRIVVDTVGEVDFAQAKARLSTEFGCVRPEISGTSRLHLKDARHMLLEHALRKSGGTAVPISLELDETHQVLVVSGPNAGGKTVVVKTVGLIALMAQMGLHVPASEASLPVYDQVFADIGDQQSLAANLSTFTAHMRNISDMALRVRLPALILIDEVGTGTDPDEGTALGIAIVDYFRRAGATTIATTHYSGLKMWASRSPGVRNASVEFDEATLRPTYRLIMGSAGASSGLEIARRMNLPTAILDQARSLIEPSHAQAQEYLKLLKTSLDEQETLRAALQEERDTVAHKYSTLDLDFAQRESKRREDFNAALAGVVREFTQESERLIRGLKDRAEADRLKRAAAKGASQLRRAGEVLREKATQEGTLPETKSATGAHANSTALMNSAEIAEGDRVMIRALDQAGIVESIHSGVYTVLVGSLRFRAGQDEIRLIESAARSSPGPSARIASARGAELDEVSEQELKIIGMTADEATATVDKFLDTAFLAGVDNIRIIHGHGKGILRKAVAELLTHHPQVDSFQAAPADKGGAGATLVTLRK